MSGLILLTGSSCFRLRTSEKKMMLQDIFIAVNIPFTFYSRLKFHSLISVSKGYSSDIEFLRPLLVPGQIFASTLHVIVYLLYAHFLG